MTTRQTSLALALAVTSAAALGGCRSQPGKAEGAAAGVHAAAVLGPRIRHTILCVGLCRNLPDS